jgi:hypothetical protein
LVERCLEPHPLARPHSALELAHALESLSGMATPLQLAPRTKKNAARSGVWSWLGLGTAVAVLSGVVGLRVAQDHKPRRPTITAARAVPRRAPHR